MLFDVDSLFRSRNDFEVTATAIDLYVKRLAFKNLDEGKNFLPFVIDCITKNIDYWTMLAAECDEAYFTNVEQKTILIFHQSADCGCIRTYRFTGDSSLQLKLSYSEKIKTVKNEEIVYELLDSIPARHIYSCWHSQKERATNLPTEFVRGRLENTSVHNAVIFTKEDGCVACGREASYYAATTIGDSSKALMLKLPVCGSHMQEARQHPTVFDFLASLFHLKLNMRDVAKYSYIPDELVPEIHALVAEELGGNVGQTKKTSRGWELWIDLASSWRWLLRIGSFTDFAYMLFEPGVKKPRYRSDSARDHPEVKFFPNHEHSAPDRKSDTISPSFMYGIPVFDLPRFYAIGEQLGAYKSDHT